jgi:hypothetical protein
MLAANGSPSWFADLGTCVPSAVAAGPANIVVVACTDGVIDRFDPTGAALPAWTSPDNSVQTHTVAGQALTGWVEVFATP